MAQSDADLIRAYQQTTAAVRARVESFALAAWGQMPSHRDADVERFLARVIPLVSAGQMQMAKLTDAYLSRALGIPLGGVDLAQASGAAIRNGVPPETVYRRPAASVYAALTQGVPYSDAVKAGAGRLKSVLASDMQLAQRAQEHKTLRRGRTPFYRRVLTGAETCALCVIASTQRYRTSQLKAIHPGCDCGVAGVAEGEFPEAVDSVLDPALLEATHAKIAAFDTGASDRGARDLGGNNPVSDYLDLIVVREHGEYGPTLTWRDHAHTGPDQVHH